MAHENPPPQLDRFARNLVREKARQVIGHAGIAAQDREDVEQALILGFLKRRQSYDARRGWTTTFTRLALTHTLANLLRDRDAKKRAAGATTSLSKQVTAEDGTGTELDQVIEERAQDTRLGRRRRRPEEAADLVLDLANILAELPEHLRRLAERLRTDTITQVARDLGRPRSTVADWVRELRRRFEQAGLRDYL